MIRQRPAADLVGKSFNPSGNQDVDVIKMAAAALIDAIEGVPTGEGFAEDRHWMKHEAIKAALSASMWGVKAATLKP